MRKSSWVIFLCFVVLGTMWLAGCAPEPVDVPDEVIEARDEAITLASQDDIPVPQDAVWTARNITPTGLVGYSTFQFSVTIEAVNWIIEVGYPIVLEPTYEVTIFQDDVEVWSGEIE